ncbi:MAG: hypothetical protein NC111_01880 [Bacteroides sp.]|nr:hypothetical protein [Bacteroides sp.]MCM1414184.1 hypothetical protein [Bacteroides sp.]MCM1471266.1 hypothetical protein [Bacteroides sp.]
MKKFLMACAMALTIVALSSCNNTKAKLIQTYEEGTEQVNNASTLGEKNEVITKVQEQVKEIGEDDPSGILKLANDKEVIDAIEKFNKVAGISVFNSYKQAGSDFMNSVNTGDVESAMGDWE